MGLCLPDYDYIELLLLLEWRILVWSLVSLRVRDFDEAFEESFLLDFAKPLSRSESRD